MAPDVMTDFERVSRVLERHISPIHARSVLRHALSEHKMSANQFTLTDLAKIKGALERGLRLFADERVCTRALRDVADAINGRAVRVEPCSISIDAEVDISRARNAARAICERVGASGFTIQKVTTIVSELARNIVSYTSGGKIELIWKDGSTQRIVIRAIDQGPGITNLPLILSGDYQSKTGLGRGLSGTKRLSDHFDISTGPTGTRVLAELRI